VGDDRLDTRIDDRVAYAPEAGWANVPQFQRKMNSSRNVAEANPREREQ